MPSREESAEQNYQSRDYCEQEHEADHCSSLIQDRVNRLDKKSQVDGRYIRKALDYLPLCFGRFFRRRGVGQQYMKLWCFLEDPGRENYEEIRCEISPVDLPDASYPCFDLHPLNIKGKPVSRPHLEFTGDPLLQRHFNHITTRPA